VLVSPHVVARNTALLSRRLLERGITLVGVTKAVDGEPAVGRVMLAAGAAGLADSRLPALTRLAAHALAPLTLIRAPQPHELEAAAQVADRVFLADAATARELGARVPGVALEVLLTVDLGDRREGVLPSDVPAAAHELATTPGLALAGIAVNFACLSGQLPSQELFRKAEGLLASVADLCPVDPLLSLGGTCCLQHLDGYRPRFATELRSGGGLLYGYDFVSGLPIDGVARRDPVLRATVLECFRKPPAPPCETGLDAFGHVPDVDLPKEGDAWYALIALGRRDCEPSGLRPLLPGARVVGMTSDVAVIVVPDRLEPGDRLLFTLDYDALVRAVTSPFVELELTEGDE
jgi:predicted amino acid racemase